MRYEIISTGSKGNAVVFNDKVMVDCGVSFSKLAHVYKKLRLILLTHEHCDHFNPKTISRLALERPTIRFAAPEWLIGKLLLSGVPKPRIDVLALDTVYCYGSLSVTAFETIHDVRNCGYKIIFDSDTKPESLVYATDTCSLPDIPNYDYYFVEANYENEDELAERIKEKQEQGKFVYEFRVKENHMSREYIEDWLYRNAHENSQYVFLHEHK